MNKKHRWSDEREGIKKIIVDFYFAFAYKERYLMKEKKERKLRNGLKGRR